MSLTNGSQIGIRIIYNKYTDIYLIAECIYSPDFRCQLGCEICSYRGPELSKRGIRGKGSCSSYIYEHVVKNPKRKSICSNSLKNLNMVYAIRYAFNRDSMNLFSSRYLYNNMDKIIIKDR